jgi:RNA polymerase-binding protein
VPFIATVIVPPQWDCRVCSQPAGTLAVDPPPADSPAAGEYLGGKSHLGHVKSRRSEAEGDALMAESLARRDHPELFNIWGKTGRRKSLGRFGSPEPGHASGGFGGHLAVTVQGRGVGGGPAGVPAF